VSTAEALTQALDEAGRCLLWRCRRGIKELDVLLERYARPLLARGPSADRAVFARLLELPDPVLADYLLGQMPDGEPELQSLARRIRATPANGAPPAG
jgi:antitoxin CptB